MPGRQFCQHQFRQVEPSLQGRAPVRVFHHYTHYEDFFINYTRYDYVTIVTRNNRVIHHYA